VRREREGKEKGVIENEGKRVKMRTGIRVRVEGNERGRVKA
jgi:hypothetical protein